MLELPLNPKAALYTRGPSGTEPTGRTAGAIIAARDAHQAVPDQAPGTKLGGLRREAVPKMKNPARMKRAGSMHAELSRLAPGKLQARQGRLNTLSTPPRRV